MLPAVSTDAKQAILVYGYQRTIVPFLGSGEEGPGAVARLDRFDVEYAAYF